MKNLKTGVANCLRLHVLSEPRADADVVCKVRYLTEVLVDEDESTEDYYKIYLAIGAEGYCDKQLVDIRN
jgi:hypothetical protein